MIQQLRNFRIIPIVLLAAASLFALKAVGLLFGGGYALGPRGAKNDGAILTLPAPSQTLQAQTYSLEKAPAQSARKLSWMQEMFNYPVANRSSGQSSAQDAAIVTGVVNSSKPAAKEAASGASPPASAGQPPQTKPAAEANANPALSPPRPIPAAERAILERLQERRQELDTRARELDLRESLLKAAEQRLEARLNELKAAEAKINAALQKKDESEAGRFKGLIAMYENMRPKDAAKIFDRLDLKILVEIVRQINPRRMGDILAQMSPEAAERLTQEIASQASGADKPPSPAELPKIEGVPNSM